MTDCTIAVDLHYSRKHRHPGERRDPSLLATGAIVSVRPMDVLERPLVSIQPTGVLSCVYCALHDWIPAFAGMTDCTIAVDLHYSRKHRHPGESRDPSLVATGAIVSAGDPGPQAIQDTHQLLFMIWLIGL